MADFSALQAVANLSDFVLSNDGKLAYITTSSGELLRWDIEAKTFLSPIILGGNLSTIDLSADGSYLLVGRSNMVNETPGETPWEYVGHTIIDRVRTDTFAVTPMDLRVTGRDRGVFNLTLVGQDMALVANDSSGAVQLRYFSALGETIPNSAAPGLGLFHIPFLIPSADDRYVFILDAGLSGGPMKVYDTQTPAQIAANDVPGSNIGVADINSNAGLVANIVVGRIYVLDFQLSIVKDFTSLLTSDFIIGAQFTADGHHLLLWSDQNRQLRVFDTQTWSQVSTVALQSPTNHGGSARVGPSDVSADGRLLFLDNLTGFEIVDLQSKLSINLTGSTSNDTYYGSVGVDNLAGGDGADILRGAESADVLSGGASDDVLEGGPGDDVIDGEAGFDTVVYTGATAGVTIDLRIGLQAAGGAGADTLSNVENVIGSNFDDVLTGNGTYNTLEGRDGNDLLNGDGLSDTLNGGAGNDTVTYATATLPVSVSLALTSQQVTLGSGDDTLISIENLIGSSLDDTLEGNAGDNRLIGGLGVDTLSYERASGGVTVSLAVTTPQDTGGGGADEIQGFENLKGSGGNDVLTGDAGANVIEGGSGADILSGGAGDDTLIGGGDGNTAYGGLGDDDIRGGNFRNTVSYADLTGGVGVVVDLSVLTPQNTIGGGIDKISGYQNLVGTGFNDTLTGDGGANLIEGGAGFDTLNGGGGLDTARYTTASAGVTVSLAASGVQATGGGGDDILIAIEGVEGSAFDDLLIASSLSNVIAGGGGIDTLSYRAMAMGVTATLANQKASLMAGGSIVAGEISGIENLIGSGYRDTLTGDGGDNVIDSGGNSQFGTIEILDGGAGVDTLTFDYVSSGVEINLAWTVQQDAEGAGLLTLRNFENVRGSYSHDILWGDDNDNVLSGAAGDDILRGLGGNDTLDGGDGVDEANYAMASVALTINLSTAGPQNTGVGLDTLISIENIHAGLKDDVLIGNASDNVIYGGLGDDLIQGGLGNDRLDGGEGSDTASFAGVGSGVQVSLFASFGPIIAIAAGDTLVSIENLIGSDHDDIFMGADGTNVFDGGQGDDLLAGFEGDDALRGGVGDDVLDGGLGADILDGGDGADTAHYRNETAGVTVTLASALQPAGSGAASGDVLTSIENLSGSAFADSLTGDGGINTLDGGGGGDVLMGEGGNDLLVGGDGDDTLFGGLGDDQMFGGQGANTASYADLTGGQGVTVSLGLFGPQDTGGGGMDSLSAIQRITGSQYGDILTGNGLANILSGGEGSDVLYGLAGADVLVGGGGTAGAPDFLYGGAGNDTYYVASTLTSPLDLVFEGALFAGSEAGANDVDVIHSTGQHFWDYYSVGEILHIDNAIEGGAYLIGGKDAANKTIHGSSGTDYISTYGRNARVDAGAGTDAISFDLYGLDESYRGANTVVMKAGSGADYVHHFRSGVDKIDLTAFNFGITGQQVLDQAVNVDNAGTANDYSYFYLTSAGGVDNFVVFVGLLSSQLSAGDFIT